MRKGCPSGKVSYESQLDAHAAALRFWKNNRRAQKHPRRAYLCPRKGCGKWHLTSMATAPKKIRL